MLKQFRHILMLLILISGTLQALAEIGPPDQVCVGTTRKYWVEGMPGSTYTWKIDGVIQSSTSDFIQKIWATAGSFNLEVQEHQDGCNGDVQSSLISVFDLPTAFAGNPGILCYGSTFMLSEATTQNSGTLLWTSSGDGAFDNTSILKPIYTPGTNDLLTGKVFLTLTAQGLGDILTCSPAVSTIELNIIRYGAVLSSANITCFGAKNGIITIESSSGGSGNYQFTVNGTDWSNALEFKGLEKGDYIVQMKDMVPPGCITTIDTIKITEPEPLAATTEFKDASCLGDDGTISVFPTGGSGAYEFALNGIGWQTAGYFSGLIPGTYIVHISDANVLNCNAIVDTIVISKPLPLIATVTPTNVTCFAGSDGFITISDPKNGSGDYKFSIDNGTNWNSGLLFSKLFAGTYAVQMLDMKATTCVETIASITITQPAQLTATAAKIDVSCFGGNNGSITITNPAGGSGSFEYIIEGKSWTGSGSFTGLVAGKYNLQMRDANTPACLVPIGEYVINEPLQLMATVTAKDISCYGAKDGLITITDAKNGLPDYQYSIDGTTWDIKNSFPGLGPNTYKVRLRDAKACIEDLETIVIIEPKPLTATVASTNATCLGNDGTITITNPENSVSGLYEYSIDGSTWTADGAFKGLHANTYHVRIRDTKLLTCERTIETIIITEPAPLLATASKTNVTCFGGNDGTITVSGQLGGSGVYQYSKDGVNWIDQPLFTGLIASGYTVLMRDKIANECLITVGTYIISEPLQLSATALPTDVTCFGGNNGAITFANQLGGSGNYQYSLNGTDWISGKIDKLIAGIYTLQMRDADAITCLVSLGLVEVKEPEELTAIADLLDVSCFGGNDGKITFTKPLNGTGPYKYSVDGGISWRLDGVFPGLTAKVYTMMMIQDVNNCQAKLESVEIHQPDLLAATVTRTNETVTGANDGTISIIGQKGGSGNFEYSTDDTSWQFTPIFAGLTPATYIVWIQDADAKGCKISRTVIVLPAGAITAKLNSTPVTCYNGNDGSIIFSEPTGAAVFEYSVDGGEKWQPSAIFAGLTAQNYLPVVRDLAIPSNRTDLGNILIKQPAILSATVTASSETFAGAGNAVITISAPKGGSLVYEYSIDNITWGAVMTFPNLASATYQVWIRDKNAPDCKISIEKIIHPTGALSAEIVATNITCNIKNGGSNNGSILFNDVSGATDYEFSINDGVSWQKSGDYTGQLAAGTYKTMLRDKANKLNQIALKEITISQPPELEALLSPTLPLCAGTTGSVTVFARRGLDIWLDGKYIMAAGETKIFTVTDENGCIATASYKMPTPLKITATAVVVVPKCPGEDGTVTISATGGTGKFAGTGIFAVKSGRNYNFAVTDDNGCVSNLISGAMPAAPAKLVATITPDNFLCFGSVGSLSVAVTGGSGAFTYLWDDPAKQKTKIASGLIAGTYSVTVTDLNGCPPTVAKATVKDQSAAITAIAGVTVQPSCLTPKGTIEVAAPSGINYEYSKGGTTFQASPVFTGLDPASYSVKVRDKLTGCESPVIVLTVNKVPLAPALPVAGLTHPNCLVATGIITVTAPLGTIYEYSIDGTNYQDNPVFAGLVPGNYSVRVKEKGTDCETTSVSVLTINPVPVPPVEPVASVTHPNCTVKTGTIRVTNPIGAAYQYSLNGKPYQISPVFSLLAPGDYSVKVKGTGIGCETTATTMLTVNPVPVPPATPVADIIQPNCNVKTGTITVTSTVPAAGISYILTGTSPFRAPVSNATGVFAGLPTNGSYKIKVTDSSSGCESTETIVRIDPMPLNPSTPLAKVTVNPTCNNLDGTVVITSPVGPDYEYTIAGKTQTSPEFVNLKTNTYAITVRNTKTGCISNPGSVIVPAIPPSPVLAISSFENSLCFGGKGSISFTVTYPIGVVTKFKDGIYTIKYLGGAFSNVSVISGKAGKVPALAGTYTNLTIEANGCTSDETGPVTIGQPTEIVITPKITAIDLKTHEKGAISLQVSGGTVGTGGYIYKWSTGETIKNIEGLNEGTYDVTVTDKNGCLQSKSIVIPTPNYPPVAFADKFTSSCSAITGDLIGNDSDPENDPFFIDVIPVKGPVNGKVTLRTDGTFEYQANPRFDGTDSFQYAIYDSKHYQGDTATVTLIIILDVDHDGLADADDPDADGDGILNKYEGFPDKDTDGDGFPDYLDIDADGDGIVDNIEAQSTRGYIRPSFKDVNGNGVDDAYDKTIPGGVEIIPVDTDGDGIPDYLDSDSDGDGVPDYIEGHDFNSDGRPDIFSYGKDTDADGLDDAYDNFINVCTPSENMLGSNAPLQDFDGDGIKDWRDEDDDNDKILTRWEDVNGDGVYSNDDIDFDGKPEYLDFGRDCDLFIPDAFSPNGDNIHDFFQIYCIDHYPKAKIYIFDQLGNKLFEKANYGNLDIWKTHDRAWWSGRQEIGPSNVRDKMVPPGTYYYVLDLGNGEVKKSYVFVSY